jgi:hypothetical protein
VDGAPLEVIQGAPVGGNAPEGTPNQAGFSPDYEPEEIFEIASYRQPNSYRKGLRTRLASLRLRSENRASQTSGESASGPQVSNREQLN